MLVYYLKNQCINRPKKLQSNDYQRCRKEFGKIQCAFMIKLREQ